MTEKRPTAAVVVIGDEVLSGRTSDENLSYLAQRLTALGIDLLEARVVRDNLEQIVHAVNVCRAAHTYLFTTGGIGPTHDDITVQSIAAAFGVPVVRNSEAERRLISYYGPVRTNDARMRMADVPAGAQLIDNPVSQAPGFQMENVFVLPGVPTIMRAMFDLLSARLRGGTPLFSVALTTSLPEGQFAERLGELQRRFPDVAIGSYPFAKDGRYRVRLIMRGVAGPGLDTVEREVKTLIDELGGQWEKEA